MVKKEVNGRIVKLDDKKLLLSLAFVFVIGTLFSGTLTGNAGRILVKTELQPNEFNMIENSAKLLNSNLIRLNQINEDGSILVHVNNGRNTESRKILAGHELYINGLFVTNVDANYRAKIALLRIN
jgi:hypothetical protein